MRVCLVRSGTVLFADNHDASPVAGNQDALGVFRYLKQSGHDLCILGPAIGDFGVPTFSPDFSRTPYGDTEPEEYVFRLNMAIAELRRWEPDVVVNVMGQQPSTSNPCNPYGSSPLRTAITTSFPVILACHDLSVPRIGIINDPRNLPREQELQYMPGAIPKAILSQQTKTSYWRSEKANRSMERREVYAAVENWWSYGVPYQPLDVERQNVTVIAHSHAHDLRVYGPERAKVWQEVLTACDAPLEIYGHGWEDDKWRGVWCGEIKHDEVQGVLARSQGGPMIALQAEFATGKIREYVLAGALPRPVSFSRFHYDKLCRYLPANHPARIQPGERWGALWDKGYVEELREKSTPDFAPLEECIEQVFYDKEHSWGGFRWV